MINLILSAIFFIVILPVACLMTGRALAERNNKSRVFDEGGAVSLATLGWVTAFLPWVLSVLSVLSDSTVQAAALEAWSKAPGLIGGVLVVGVLCTAIGAKLLHNANPPENKFY